MNIYIDIRGYSDWGDFRRRHAVDITSYYFLWLTETDVVLDSGQLNVSPYNDFSCFRPTQHTAWCEVVVVMPLTFPIHQILGTTDGAGVVYDNLKPWYCGHCTPIYLLQTAHKERADDDKSGEWDTLATPRYGWCFTGIITMVL